MLEASLRLSNPYPVTDTLEVFKGHTASGALSRCYQRFTETGVHIPHEAGFLTSAFLQQTFGRLCSKRLQAGSQVLMTGANTFHTFPTVDNPIRINGYVGKAKINTDKVVGIGYGGIRQMNGLQEEPFAVPENQISFSFDAGLSSRVIVPTDKRHDLATIHGKNRNPIQSLIGKKSVVPYTRTVRTKAVERLFIPPIGSTDNTHGTDSPLRSQSKFSTNTVIARVMQACPARCLQGKRSTGYRVTRRIELSHRPA